MRRYLDSLWVLASVVAASAQTPSVPIGPGSGGGGGGGGAGVTSLATSCPGGVAINPSTGAVTLGLQTVTRTATDPPASPVNVNTDCGSIIYLNSAVDRSPVLANPAGAGFPAGWATLLCNINAAQTLTPSAGTIGGAGTKVLGAGTASSPVCLGVISNGVNNYQLESFASPVVITAGSTATSGITSGDLISSTSNLAADSGIPAANVITKAGGGTLASNAVTAMTCPGTAASSVGAVTCVVDYQPFAVSGTWTKPSGNYTITRVCGIGAGGSGGSGAIVTSGTSSSGGAGGGGAFWDCIEFKTADLAATVAVTVAGTTAGGAAKTSTTTTLGTIGNQGGTTTFGSLHGWSGGGGGQAGQNSAAASTGGAGAGPFAAGANQNTVGSCTDGVALGNGGTATTSSVSFASQCPSGGSGSSATGVGTSAGYSGHSASGGGGGGGLTTVPAASVGAAGGLALGCQASGASPGGTANGATPAVATQAFSYQPGCGGGGGGGNNTNGATVASGAAGSGPGAGGGGGGSGLAGASVTTSGAGGAGFAGFLAATSY